jgi:hypothetical protein
MALDDIDESADPLEPEWLDCESIEQDGLAAAGPAPLSCWRCGRVEIPVDGRCPSCAARVVDEPTGSARPADDSQRLQSPLLFVLGAYALFLLTSVVWGWVLLADHGRMTPDQVLEGTLVVEVVDTVLVFVALAIVGRLPLPERSGRTRASAWLLGLPALALLLCLNLVYGIAIRDYIKPPDFLNPPATPITFFTVAIICLQPAIVEELFFRYLALGVLVRATGTATPSGSRP